MDNNTISISQNYTEAVFHRNEKPLPPVNFEPNWTDHPSRYKIYNQVERFALPLKRPDRCMSMAEVLSRFTTRDAERNNLSFDALSLMFHFAHGVLSRRLRITWNPGLYTLAAYNNSVEARGTASGGGLYPTEIYWACGRSGPLLPGLYHYDNAHHALARLATGDATGYIQRAAFEHPSVLATDQFLLLSLNVWKNAFKYNNFGYHVITQDLGALISSLRFLAAGFQTDLQPILWYQDEPLNHLLGLELDSESVFAIVPLPLLEYSEPCKQDIHPSASLPTSRLIKKSSFQRSKEITVFDLNREVHRSTLLHEGSPTPGRKFSQASVDDVYRGSERIALPPPAIEGLQMNILDTFQRRRSSFGSFSHQNPLSLVELATMLAFGAAICTYKADVKMVEHTSSFTRQVVFANTVEGLEQGIYAYDQQQHCLWCVQKGDMRLFLQQHYFLQNYNPAETGALIALVGHLDGMLEVYGNRGYRILNAEVGMAAQSIYMAAAALSCACGAALGFNNGALNTVLHLDQTQEKTLLFLMVGHERFPSADFDTRFE
ncbi:SagB/ThcOx family dehydrogenase [Ktedonosporobacter rubrisoli]|uniref:SagB/ThcOx family dehydrogenase n=1 Tax=Ktedonosporobacter rubrisoli TaxID=2509675 RepID=A0A4P6K4E3_KTERU|nr:SagB family peptide dehydrogenase [Ktedonosporobacter rubrisoli]QBD82832.1 SagB/ThcOx family dehydrogenase [Ktedonosporobacter rubrisoli]